jgi:transglutaminase-like putative cysteine protease
MKLEIQAHLDYRLDEPTDLLLQLEAAAIPEQTIEAARIDISDCTHFARVVAQAGIGERIWLRAEGRLVVDYRAIVTIGRLLTDISGLERVPPHLLPGETVEYLMESRYCPSHQFESLVDTEFTGLDGGPRVSAMRDWIEHHFTYVSGSSTQETTAVDSFVKRQGVCRDYAHVLIALTRASGIPARLASVYALGVEPPDFHAVAEVFLGDEWRLVDATGMASESEMAKIGVGRDAADVAFLTAYGEVVMQAQAVSVVRAG